MKRDAEFLRKVTELAAENNMGATAKALKIPVYTLRASLLNAAMKLGEIPPQFAKKRVVKKRCKKTTSTKKRKTTKRDAK